MQDNQQNVGNNPELTGEMAFHRDYMQNMADEKRAAIATAAAEMVRPLMEAVSKLLSGNAEALQQITEALNMQNERMAALERTVKKRMPVTSVQARYINDAIKKRTHALLDDKQDIDTKAYAKLGRIIRRDVLVRCGVASLREMPEHEYSASMDQIAMWSNILVIRDVVWEARERVEAMEGAEQTAGVDGA